MNHPDPGVYRSAPAHLAPPRPAVFLDRDGVIVEECGYLHTPSAVRLIPGAAQAIARLNAARIPVIAVTNQAGIGRGYYGWAEFHATQDVIHQALAADGATLDALWACAYHPGGLPPYASDHPYRKPNPGMLLDAASHLSLDLARSVIVGDKLSDLEAGLHAGLTRLLLVRTGYGHQHELDLPKHPALLRHVHVCADLAQAVEAILSPGL